MGVTPPTYNFDVTFSTLSNNGISDQASFEAFLSNYGFTNLTVSDFLINGLQILAKIYSDVTWVDLNNKDIAIVNKIGYLPNLTSLDLSINQLPYFNPSVVLSSDITLLNLQDNLIDNSGYTAMELWANAQPAFTSTCVVNFINNIDSVSGTNLEAILISKNCNVIA